ncbi:hypothetical protein BDK51DRAFT_50308 [Blyttiomyces helicus]|uniref:F-box domain-containing protein n=1 Tax=Blyttiomyces helicus TaxID=388810 RepID=A0A4P9VZ55_9FUNG|nr:hypothetical protein BDK51DRAFT_50308 [Blyttiomyces helicus]|eukprot:RKO83086.1 hypothetical protein BDK51DRAFT_50308 [Blyttiomyces helicus]
MPRCGFIPIQHVSAAVGTQLRVWAPSSCRPVNELTATDLPNIHTIELRALGRASDDSRVGVTGAFIAKPASLHPPLRRVFLGDCLLESEATIADLLAVFPTIDAFHLDDIYPLTLAALERHPPLRHLDIRSYTGLSSASIVSYLRKRGGELRFLRCEGISGVDNAVVDILSTHALRLEAVCFMDCPNIVPMSVSDDGSETAAVTFQNIQFLALLARGCPQLKEVSFGSFNVKTVDRRVVPFLETLGGRKIRNFGIRVEPVCELMVVKAHGLVLA